MKIKDLNKRKTNFDSKNFIILLFLLIYFFKYRRSAMAQRQREEEQVKGKLTAEEAKRQVRTKNKSLYFYKGHDNLLSERTAGTRIC